MNTPEFKFYELSLVKPSFDSPLTDMIIELEHLRKKKLEGSTHPSVFFQLKHLFHTLESIGSARIEGNNTTIAEYIETKIEENTDEHISYAIREIRNIEEATAFIENNVNDYPINKKFISEIHRILVKGLPLNGEGDKSPGVYRKHNIKIAQSEHLPPDYFSVEPYMNDLFQFINDETPSKYDLMKTAIAHHRFVWIHPFGNGNGRTVRLFTYAMLIKSGFNVNVGRIINPTAVFCNNRTEYYDKLSKADKGKEEGILEWCEYVLKGLKEEIEKVDKLMDYDYLKKEILIPAINISLERKIISENESEILKRTIEHQLIQNSDLQDLFKGKQASEVSRQIKKLKDKKMLISESENSRKYVLRFDNNYLLRGIIQMLNEKGFLPIQD